MNETLYFAYGSNMDLYQMNYRCPSSEVIGKATLNDYKLAFRGHGFATVLPSPGDAVQGVLWWIASEDERRLDFYEGYPRHYEKETVTVYAADGTSQEVMVYTMAAPLKDRITPPSPPYLEGILRGCEQNGIDPAAVEQAARESKPSRSQRPSQTR